MTSPPAAHVSQGKEMTEEELERALCTPAPVFAQEALAYAMADAEMSARVSHRILAAAVDAARDGRPDSLGFGPIYAVFLMAHHHDRGAFDRLSEIARLPFDMSDTILGDTVTEDMCAILWSVCANDGARLWSLVDDPAAASYWRDAALRAILIGVGEGVLEREETLQEIRHRLEAAVAVEPPVQVAGDDMPAWDDMPTWLAIAMTDLGAGSDLALLDLALEKGLVDEITINRDDWHNASPGTHEEALDRIQQRDGWRYPVDPLRLRGWAYFAPPPPRPRSTLGEARAKAKAKARAKTKAQRKARKRSRRR